MAQRFNLTRDEEKLARHLEALASRTISQVECLHYLETAQGWLSLDVNLLER